MNIIKQNESISVLLLVSVALFWGITFLMIKDAISNVPVYSFLFFRFFVAFLLLYTIRYNKIKNITKTSLFYGLLLGFILFLAYTTQTFGLLYAQSSVVAFLTGFFVVLVPILSFLLFKTALSFNVILASVISLIGIYLLSLSGDLQFNKGEVFSFICAILFALHLIFTGKIPKKENIYNIVLLQFLVVAILSFIFSLIIEEKTILIDFDFTFIKALIITSIFATVYAFLIQTYIQQFISDSKTAIIFTLEPLSAAVFGVYIGGEILNFDQIIGAILIILATLIAQIKMVKLSFINNQK